MSNNRKASLQKCMYINEETPHRDPSTIFHSPFNKGSKSISYNNPSYMSSEVFYPHQQNNFNQVSYSRTPKRSLVQDNNADQQYSNSKSPMRPQGQSSQSKSQAKYSYINDYQKFLEKQDQQSDTKSQMSHTNSSYNKNNQNSFQGNKTYHFGNKSIASPIEVGLPPQNSSTTPKNAKNIQQQLNNIVNQDTTATSYKNRSHSQYDIGDVKKKIDLDNHQQQNYQGKDRSGYQTPSDHQSQKSQKSQNNLSLQNPSLIKLEQVRNNQKIIQESQKNNYPINSNSNTRLNQAPQNINNQSQTPKQHSRNGSQVFYFPNQQKQQDPQQYHSHQQQYDQLSNSSSQKNSASKGNFKLIKSPQNLVRNAQTTHQQHYNSLSKSPTPKNLNRGEEVRSFNEPQNQTQARNVSTTPKRVIDLTSNLSTKGSSSNPISQSGALQNDRQSNCGDDAKSVTSSSSYISQLICNNCVNKDLITEKQLRQQRERERQAQLERQALENEKINHYNMYMYQQEQNQNAKNKYNQEVQEHIDFKNTIKHQEQEREKNLRRLEQAQLQEENDRVYRQKLDDLKNYREQYKKDIDMQLQNKKDRQEREKMADQSILQTIAAQKEQDLHDYMNLIAQKQYQTQKIRDELQNQLMEKKKQQEQKAQEDAKYRNQMQQQLAYDMQVKEKQIQDRQDELRQFKDAWDLQQQHKQQQKVNQQRENEKILQFQEAQQEHDRNKYIYNLEKNEYLKKAAADDLKMQIDMKKEQQQREFEEKQQYGKQLKEQHERDLANARQNYHDCDRCHNNYPTSHLTKQKQHKSKPKFKV